MTYWLIEPALGKKIGEGIKAASPGFLAAIPQIPVAPMIVDTEGVAYINVVGALTKEPDPIVAFFAGANTSYRQIRAMVEAAVADPEVNTVEFFVDSGGGQVDGLFELLPVIADARDKIDMRVRADQAHSAAYAIAAVAGNIEATNRGAMFGSVGVAAAILNDPEVIHVTSTEAPEKRPDVSTEEGRAVIVAQLDAIHALFVEAIAAGRDTTVENVNQSFGRGASFVAEESLSRGMIDSIAQPALAVAAEFDREFVRMNISELEASHPELCEALRAEGVKQGIRQERDRVSAHLNLGESSGDLATAHKAIRDGEELTQNLVSTYLAAGIKSAEISARTADAVASEAATVGVTNTEATFEERFIKAFDALGSE